MGWYDGTEQPEMDDLRSMKGSATDSEVLRVCFAKCVSCLVRDILFEEWVKHQHLVE